MDESVRQGGGGNWRRRAVESLSEPLVRDDAGVLSDRDARLSRKNAITAVMALAAQFPRRRISIEVRVLLQPIRFGYVGCLSVDEWQGGTDVCTTIISSLTQVPRDLRGGSSSIGKDVGRDLQDLG